jgi:hypothetical protein
MDETSVWPHRSSVPDGPQRASSSCTRAPRCSSTKGSLRICWRCWRGSRSRSVLRGTPDRFHPADSRRAQPTHPGRPGRGNPGALRADSPARRARREEFVEALLAALPVVPLTLPVMRVFAGIDAGLRAAGSRLPTSDLLIASTAISRGDEIVTGNVRHFERIAGLSVHTWGLTARITRAPAPHHHPRGTCAATNAGATPPPQKGSKGRRLRMARPSPPQRGAAGHRQRAEPGDLSGSRRGGLPRGDRRLGGVRVRPLVNGRGSRVPRHDKHKKRRGPRSRCPHPSSGKATCWRCDVVASRRSAGRERPAPLDGNLLNAALPPAKLRDPAGAPAPRAAPRAPEPHRHPVPRERLRRCVSPPAPRW